MSSPKSASTPKKFFKPGTKTSFMDINKIINEIKIKNDNETTFISIEAIP
jgi:hypothetical protein